MQRQAQKNKKIVLGITGSFGSGKSTVAGIFRALGGRVIDADRLAHASLQPGTPEYKRVVRAFGRGILRADNRIDRQRLARIVFNKAASLKRLNKIIHPAVIRRIKRGIESAKKKFIIVDAPLLIEAGLQRIVDRLIVVRINPAKQIRRIKLKTQLGKTDILKRMKFQLPLRAKERLADFIIDNNGSLPRTRNQVEKIWKSLAPDIKDKAPGVKFAKRKLRRLRWKN
jgi:dephospho-CoA kinase